MLPYRKTTALAVCLSIVCTLYAQDSTEFEHVIASKAFGKDRKVYVFLPDRYLRDTTQAFSVTYVLDAQYDQFWNMAKSNIDYLVDSRCAIPMIVVGIHSDNRGSDFRPPADELCQHLEEEVIPLIEAKYRVGPIRTIVGHSWGGAFVGNTLFSARADMFNAYIGISPSLGYQDNMILRNADSTLRAGGNFGKFVYCSSGDVGRREFEFGGEVAVLDSLMQAYPNATLTWRTRTFTGMDHWSCVIPSLNDGLVQMSRNYWADQQVIEAFSRNKTASISAQIRAFNASRDSLFGYHYSAGPRYFRFIGDDFSDMERYEQALELYDLALEDDPESYRLHSNMAAAYKALEKPEQALASYKKALQYIDVQRNTLSERGYSDMKKWLQEKIAELE